MSRQMDWRNSVPKGASGPVSSVTVHGVRGVSGNEHEHCKARGRCIGDSDHVPGGFGAARRRVGVRAANEDSRSGEYGE